jgi:hypothetical protein
MHDCGSGIDAESFSVTADFAVDDVKPGDVLAGRLRSKGDGVWELKLVKPITDLPKRHVTVSVKDNQGNTTRVERTFSVERRTR